MAIIEASSGPWLDKSKLTNGQRAKLTTAADWEASRHKDERTGNQKQQLVVMAKFEGLGGEHKVGINIASQNGLVRAFGHDSNDWIGRLLTVQTRETNVGGKIGTALYLIPEGFVLSKDQNNYLVIVPKDKAMAPEAPPESVSFVQVGDDDEKPEVPF